MTSDVALHRPRPVPVLVMRSTPAILHLTTAPASSAVDRTTFAVPSSNLARDDNRARARMSGMEHQFGPAVVRASSVLEVATDERCFIRELANASNDPSLSIAHARVEPGVTTQRHRLSVNERYVVLTGTGRMEVGALPATEVGAGDVVLIPAGTAQRITNTGTTDLVFCCVCDPPFSPGCYEALEG